MDVETTPTKHLREYDISHPVPAVVKESTRITPLQSDVEVRHIVLEIGEEGLEFVEAHMHGIQVVVHVGRPVEPQYAPELVGPLLDILWGD